MLLKVRALESLFLLSLYNISQKLTKKLKSIFKNLKDKNITILCNINLRIRLFHDQKTII